MSGAFALRPRQDAPPRTWRIMAHLRYGWGGLLL
jgi:hypothetical protein